MMEKIKAWLSMIAAAVGVLTIIGTVAYQAGWVVQRADAESMINTAVQLIATQAAQAVLDEAKARETADLIFQKSLLVDRITTLMGALNRTPAQEFELQQMIKDVDRIEARLDALQ